MPALLPVPPSEQITIDRRKIHSAEETFASILGDVAKLLWPKSTAAQIATLVGCSVRNAEMYLSGQQKWSGDALAAIVAEILKRHSLRNVRVVKRN
jgi:hypothetical protein